MLARGVSTIGNIFVQGELFEVRSFVRGKACMPYREFCGQLLHQCGLLVLQIRCFAEIFGEIIELRPTAIVIAVELPLLVPHGQIGQVLVSFVLFAVRRTTEVDGRFARLLFLAE